MIFYEEGVSVEDLPEEQSSSSESSLTYEDIYNAVYNGYMDAYTEIKIQEAEEDETTSEDAQRVIVDNFPTYQNVKVNNLNDINFATITDAIAESNALAESDSNNDTTYVEFASDTDSRLYTAETVGAVGSADAQTVAYLLDVRNILLIFLLIWFVLYLTRIIRNVFIKFTKGKGESV